MGKRKKKRRLQTPTTELLVQEPWRGFLVRHVPERPSLLLTFDGGCHANGRPDARAAWGFQLLRLDGHVLAEDAGPVVFDVHTSNVAEWFALGHALRHLLDNNAALPAGAFEIRGDSQLVLQQLTGERKAHNKRLQRLRDRCRTLVTQIGRPCHTHWVPRERNGRCDELAAAVLRL